MAGMLTCARYTSTASERDDDYIVLHSKTHLQNEISEAHDESNEDGGRARLRRCLRAFEAI
jgi:hypothetical protein